MLKVNLSCLGSIVRTHLELEKMSTSELSLQLMNFTTVMTHCKSLNSGVWEVIQGDQEWKAMLPKLKQGTILLLSRDLKLRP